MKKIVLFLFIFLISVPCFAKKKVVEPQKKWPILLFQSYMRTIKNSRRSRMFRNLYYRVGKYEDDVLNNGDLSCAYYVTFILYHFGLVREWHTSVIKTVEDMKESGWYSIKRPRVGSVIVWARAGNHKHIGFYLGRGFAISNSSRARRPLRHRWRRQPITGKKRKVIDILWNKKLEKNKSRN